MIDQNLSVCFIRLVNGEDILAAIPLPGKKRADGSDYDNVEGMFIFVEPLKVSYLMGSKQEKIIISLNPWVFPGISNVTEYHVKMNDILLMSDPTETMKKYYWEAVSKKELESVDMTSLEELLTESALNAALSEDDTKQEVLNEDNSLAAKKRKMN